MKFNSNSLGNRFQHYFFYCLLHFRLTWLAHFILYFIVFYYTLCPSVRKRASYYIDRRFLNASFLKKFMHCYLLYYNFAKLLFTRIAFAHNNTLAITSKNKAQKKLLSILNDKDGCLVLSGHLGAWQLGMYQFEEVHKPINLVQLIQKGDNDKHYFQHKTYKNKNSIHMISPENGFNASLEISAALTRDEIVCMTADRVLYDHEKYILMDFLGDKIPLPLAPFSISSITQKPILVTFSVIENHGIDGVYAQKISIPYGIHKQPELLKPYIEQYVQALEFMVANYPHQFFNFYNLWDMSNYGTK